jgi:hypothetical protein
VKYFSEITNIFINGDNYLDGFLGLRWLPSDDAKRKVADYERDVANFLYRYNGIYTSYWILQEIRAAWPKTVMIMPPEFGPKDFPKDEDNAFTGTPDNKWDKAMKPGTQSQTCGEDPVGKNSASGGGASLIITFLPRAWSVKDGVGTQGPGSAGDEILLHELIHAMRFMNGQGTRCAACPAGFRDYEEFLAVVLTNVFSSQTNRPLRHDLWGYSPMPKDLTTSQAYFDKYGKYLTPVRDVHPHLFTALKRATGIAFNPFVCM